MTNVNENSVLYTYYDDNLLNRWLALGGSSPEREEEQIPGLDRPESGSANLVEMLPEPIFPTGPKLTRQEDIEFVPILASGSPDTESPQDSILPTLSPQNLSLPSLDTQPAIGQKAENLIHPAEENPCRTGELSVPSHEPLAEQAPLNPPPLTTEERFDLLRIYGNYQRGISTQLNTGYPWETKLPGKPVPGSLRHRAENRGAREGNSESEWTRQIGGMRNHLTKQLNYLQSNPPFRNQEGVADEVLPDLQKTLPVPVWQALLREDDQTPNPFPPTLRRLVPGNTSPDGLDRLAENYPDLLRYVRETIGTGRALELLPDWGDIPANPAQETTAFRFGQELVNRGVFTPEQLHQVIAKAAQSLNPTDASMAAGVLAGILKQPPSSEYGFVNQLARDGSVPQALIERMVSMPEESRGVLQPLVDQGQQTFVTYLRGIFAQSQGMEMYRQAMERYLEARGITPEGLQQRLEEQLQPLAQMMAVPAQAKELLEAYQHQTLETKTPSSGSALDQLGQDLEQLQTDYEDQSEDITGDMKAAAAEYLPVLDRESGALAKAAEQLPSIPPAIIDSLYAQFAELLKEEISLASDPISAARTIRQATEEFGQALQNLYDPADLLKKLAQTRAEARTVHNNQQGQAEDAQRRVAEQFLQASRPLLEAINQFSKQMERELKPYLEDIGNGVEVEIQRAQAEMLAWIKAWVAQNQAEDNLTRAVAQNPAIPKLLVLLQACRPVEEGNFPDQVIKNLLTRE